MHPSHASTVNNGCHQCSRSLFQKHRYSVMARLRELCCERIAPVLKPCASAGAVLLVDRGVFWRGGRETLPISRES